MASIRYRGHSLHTHHIIIPSMYVPVFPDQFKIHESENDRQRQRDVLRSFCTALDLGYELQPPLSEFDAKIYSNKGAYIAVSEVKCRNNPAIQYPDYQIDASKIHNLIQFARKHWVRAVLIVSWRGDIRYLPLSKIAEGWDGQCDLFPRTNTQRRDRKEYTDNQYHIPLDLFRKITDRQADR